MPVDSNADLQRPPVETVTKMNAFAFYSRLAALLHDNPPAEADKPIVEKLARIGIATGRPFDPRKVDAAVAEALERGAGAGREKIFAELKKPQGKVANGWDVMGNLGRYVRAGISTRLARRLALPACLKPTAPSISSRPGASQPIKSS
jgi:hypothetical protein